MTIFRSPRAAFVLTLALGLPVYGAATLTLEAGSYANRSHIDTAMKQANLTFMYNGCDSSPDPQKIKLTTDGDCKLARDYQLGQSQDKTAYSGTVGEIIANYDEKEGDCATKTSKRLHSTYSLKELYEKFQEKQCFPSRLLIKSGNDDSRRLWKTRSNKRICSLPDTRVTKKGFPTEELPFFHLTANDSSFKIGDHSVYRYDHDQRNWCVKYRENDEKCGQWPSPLPLAYKDDGDKRYHVKATVSLSPDGKASIRAIDKSYANTAALFNDQKNGAFTNTDKSKGRIDFSTWRKANGIVRAIASSFEKDEPNANHQRSLNFFARNTFGVGITNSWCPKEHCFLGVEDEKLKGSLCSTTPEIELTNGGNGNTCHSCVGITPGLCAIEEPEVNLVKSKLEQDDNFTILHTGEYKFGQDVEKGLAKNYSKMVENPKKPGCHEGYAPAYQEIFDPGEALREGVEGRSINAKEESL